MKVYEYTRQFSPRHVEKYGIRTSGGGRYALYNGCYYYTYYTVTLKPFW